MAPTYACFKVKIEACKLFATFVHSPFGTVDKIASSFKCITTILNLINIHIIIIIIQLVIVESWKQFKPS